MEKGEGSLSFLCNMHSDSKEVVAKAWSSEFFCYSVGHRLEAGGQ